MKELLRSSLGRAIVSYTIGNWFDSGRCAKRTQLFQFSQLNLKTVVTEWVTS